MDPIPEDVRRFLEGTIESIDQLEILRVLGEAPGREWSAADRASAVQTDPATVAGHLTALHARGLLAAEKRDGGWVGRHGPRADVEPLVARLLACYRERPVSMIKLVYARSRDPLRRFADAFRLRKEEG